MMTRLFTIQRSVFSLSTLALLSLPDEGAPPGWHVPAYDASLHRLERGMIYGRAYRPRGHRITSYGPRHRRYRAPVPPRYFSPFPSPPHLVDYRDRKHSGVLHRANPQGIGKASRHPHRQIKDRRFIGQARNRRHYANQDYRWRGNARFRRHCSLVSAGR